LITEPAIEAAIEAAYTEPRSAAFRTPPTPVQIELVRVHRVRGGAAQISKHALLIHGRASSLKLIHHDTGFASIDPPTH